MKTLIIYDLNGKIVSQISDNYVIPNGLPYLEIEIPQGKYVAFVNVDTKEPIFEDIPLTEIEELENKISILEDSQINQDTEILSNMLATTEVFEMVLTMASTPAIMSLTDTKNNKNIGGNSMIEVYATLIVKGVKTIEDVPVIIRAQVAERLKQLEVPVK